MEGKVSWSAKVRPLFHSGKYDERILFCQLPLIWEEAVAFPCLLLDQPRNLAPSVFEVCKVDVDALLERGAFFFFPFPGVPLSAPPDFWIVPSRGFGGYYFDLVLTWSRFLR